MTLVSYYCHQCQRHGRRSVESSDNGIDCLNCGSGFVEIIEPEIIQSTSPVTFDGGLFTFAVPLTAPMEIPMVVQSPERLRRVFQFFGRHMGMDLAPEDGVTDEELFGDEAFQRLIDRLMRQAGINPTGSQGMSESEVAELHEFKVEEIPTELACAICQDQFQVDDKAILLYCGHQFHSECLVPWLKRVASCPTCRKDPRQPDDKQASA